MAKSVSPTFEVVEHQPWRRPMVIIVTVVISACCFFAGFIFGQNKMTNDSAIHELASQELGAAKSRLVKLEAELVDAQLSSNVQRNASNSLRQDLTDAHNDRARLREEVTFYKGLMSPSSMADGLQVAELELLPADGERQFRYQLLLTQIALRRSFIAGDVRVDVIGRFADAKGDDQAVLSLTELAELKTYPLKFRFRYFQDLAGQIALPEGFEPQHLLVTANESGKAPLQVSFEWSVQNEQA